MRRHFLLLPGIFLCLTFSSANAAGLVDYVNPLQGTDSKREFSHGNTYPAIALPWGMNVWTPQTGVNRDGWIYKYRENTIRGFRQTHQCSPWTNDYAAFSLMPVAGKLIASQDQRATPFQHANEQAGPHYYKVVLDNQISAEMAPTERGVFLRFAYPRDQDAFLVIDANSGGSEVKILPRERKIIGFCKNAPHSVPENFANYFVIQFDQPFTAHGTWQNNDGQTFPGETERRGDYVGAYVQFRPGAKVNVKVASSFISPEQAEQNLRRELGRHSSVTSVKNAAERVWNTHLGRIRIDGGTPEQLATFYSCFYRAMLFPRQFHEYDAQGKPVYYSPYDGKIHSGFLYTDTGFWDTFRAQFPLNVILFPAMHGRYMASLLDAYDQSGWLPSWSFPGHSGGMIGNHAFSVLADAHAKGIRTFDPAKALAAMWHDANAKGPRGPSIGRSGAEHYWKLGYVPSDRHGEATAKTLEYAYDDWCAWQLARNIGNQEFAEKFSPAILHYKNVFDAETGFMRGRLLDGAWAPNFDPTEWGGAFIEGGAWHYLWSVFHDVQGLANLLGGDEKLAEKLDACLAAPNTFKVGTYGHVIHEMAEMAAINMGQYGHGNEQLHHMLYMYNYVGQPWKAQYWLRQVMDRLYNSGPQGYCGDEDQGQMASWYVLSAMGLYAVTPGTDQYVIGSPLFPRLSLQLENGKRFLVVAENNSDQNVYIQSAELNGQPLSRNWITHAEIIAGGTLRFVMGPKPNLSRGIAPADKPYSFSPPAAATEEPR